MVTKIRKETPTYALERIKTLAETHAVDFAGSQVQLDMDSFGYSFEAMCQCLTELREDDFAHSLRYTPQGPWHDVYLMSNQVANGRIDDLYIKLRVTSDCLLILLCSFHPERDT